MEPDQIAIIELTLRPRKFNRVPAWLGRAAQAQFYSSLRDIHPYVSETIHDLYRWQSRMPKPFTVSNLRGAAQQDDLMSLLPSRTVTLRVTTLHSHMTHIVLSGVLPLWGRGGINLHDQPLWITHKQIMRTTYTELYASAPDTDCIDLYFDSPTAFKQTHGGYLAEPRPKYIFSSLLQRWNALASCPLPLEITDTMVSRLRVIHADVKQRTLRFARGRKAVVPGFYGHVQIAVEEPSASVRKMVNALAQFAPYSGVGIKTTVGMGQMRM